MLLIRKYSNCPKCHGKDLFIENQGDGGEYTFRCPVSCSLCYKQNKWDSCTQIAGVLSPFERYIND